MKSGPLASANDAHSNLPVRTDLPKCSGSGGLAIHKSNWGNWRGWTILLGGWRNAHSLLSCLSPLLRLGRRWASFQLVVGDRSGSHRDRLSLSESCQGRWEGDIPFPMNPLAHPAIPSQNEVLNSFGPQKDRKTAIQYPFLRPLAVC